ncbi:MAG: hypothetical protein WKF77_22850 [Planctomycetaceae bacterium]
MTAEAGYRWHAELDKSYGACVLRDPVNAKIVADSLRKFDGDRYWLTDFVVMPNHVHLLVSFADDDSMLRQCEGWKRFTARTINQPSTSISCNQDDSGSMMALIIWFDPNRNLRISATTSLKIPARQA